VNVKIIFSKKFQYFTQLLCTRISWKTSHFFAIYVDPLSWKECQCFTQLLCTRISRKASHAFSLYTMIRSFKDHNFLKYTRDDLEIDEVVIERKKINTVKLYWMRGQQKQKTTKAPWLRYWLSKFPSQIQIQFESSTLQFCADVDRWLGFQFFPTWIEIEFQDVQEMHFKKCMFRRWSAP